MAILAISRTDLIGILSGQPYTPSLLEGGDLLISVPIVDRRILLPQALFVPDSDIADFFVWAQTYLPLLNPLSSIAHVLPLSMLDWYKISPSRAAQRSVLPLAGAVVARRLFGGEPSSGMSLTRALACVASLGLGVGWQRTLIERI